MLKSDVDRKEIIFNKTSAKAIEAAPQGFFCQDDFPEIDEGSDEWMTERWLHPSSTARTSMQSLPQTDSTMYLRTKYT